MLCHYCSHAERPPKRCAKCDSDHVHFLGTGSEKVEEELHLAFPKARIIRMDRDTVGGKRGYETILHGFRAHEYDILVGTQMIAKGLHFPNVTLVGIIYADLALHQPDFRAGERLFALLMQASGRAGRDAEAAARSEVWVQTWHPQHPLYAALKRHDFAAFAATQLAERESAGLPPYSHLALLRAEARDLAVASAWLDDARAEAAALAESEGVTLYPPVPPPVSRVAGIERMQMLVESEHRARLQRLLAAWLPRLHALRGRHKGLARWAIDVDPLGI